jgi:integrase
VHLDADPHVIVRYGDGAGGPTKSGRVRRVPLFPPARVALAEMRDLDGATRIGGHVFTPLRKRNGEPRTEPYADGYDGGWSGSWHRPKKRGGKLVPLGPDGRPPRVWRDGWRERCGIRGDVTFHDLRHTFATHLVMGTWGRAWRIEEVQVLLGHTSITVTQRYARFAPEGMVATVADAERLWRDLPAPQVTSQVTPLKGRKKR